MSDSEEFASADEGDGVKMEASPDPQKDSPVAVTGDFKEESVTKGKKMHSDGQSQSAKHKSSDKSDDTSLLKTGATSNVKGQPPKDGKRGKQKGRNKKAAVKKGADNVPEETDSVAENQSKEEISSDTCTVSDKSPDHVVEKLSDAKVSGDDKNVVEEQHLQTETIERSPVESSNPTEEDEPEVSRTAVPVTSQPQKGEDIAQTETSQTDEQRSILDKLAGVAQSQKSSGWGWGSWGSSLVSAASSSVTTFTSQVGEGFHTILDTVESSLGAISPEDVAQLQKEKQGNAVQDNEEKPEEEDAGNEGTSTNEKTEPEATAPAEESVKDSSDSWFSSWGVSNITSAVQNTVSGSIDVLELLGKKTYHVISDHDPGLKKATHFLMDKGDKPNLSFILREAKEQSEIKAELDKEYEQARKAEFGAMFDEFQGLVHLEALEMLSNQSEGRVQGLLSAVPGRKLDQIKSDLIKIKQTFELDEDDDAADEVVEHDFLNLITKELTDLHLGVVSDKLMKVHEKSRKQIYDIYEQQKKEEKVSIKDVHMIAIQSLAELTAKAVEQFHKAGELILMDKEGATSCLERSGTLASFTKILCTEVGVLSTHFSDCINKAGEDGENAESVNPLVTNIYLEASNSSTYIQDAFQLLLPVLQQAALQTSPLLQQ